MTITGARTGPTLKEGLVRYLGRFHLVGFRSAVTGGWDVVGWGGLILMGSH